MKAKAINIVGAVGNGEHYIFLYDDDHARECLRTIKRFSLDPELSFTSDMAIKLSERVQALARKASTERRQAIWDWCRQVVGLVLFAVTMMVLAMLGVGR